MLAGPSSEDQRLTAATLAGLRAMPGVLANEYMLLLCWGQQEADSGSVLVWVPEGMEESKLEGLSLGPASGVGLGTS